MRVGIHFPLPVLCSGKMYSHATVATIISWVRCKVFGDEILMLKLCCCRGQLAPFPVATCRPLTSLAAKRVIGLLILLPLETGKVPRDNTVILMQNLVTNVPSHLTQLITVSCFVNVAQGWGGTILVRCSNIMTRLVMNFVKILDRSITAPFAED